MTDPTCKNEIEEHIDFLRSILNLNDHYTKLDIFKTNLQWLLHSFKNDDAMYEAYLIFFIEKHGPPIDKFKCKNFGLYCESIKSSIVCDSCLEIFRSQKPIKSFPRKI